MLVNNKEVVCYSISIKIPVFLRINQDSGRFLSDWSRARSHSPASCEQALGRHVFGNASFVKARQATAGGSAIAKNKWRRASCSDTLVVSIDGSALANGTAPSGVAPKAPKEGNPLPSASAETSISRATPPDGMDFDVSRQARWVFQPHRAFLFGQPRLQG